jgi:NADH:ubiquinone reductase (H+-translocating)
VQTPLAVSNSKLPVSAQVTGGQSMPWRAKRSRVRPAFSAASRRSGARRVVDFGRLKLTGRLGWLVWDVAHIYFLIGFRNRMAVAVDWLRSYLTYQRGARLITGEDMRMSPPALKP